MKNINETHSRKLDAGYCITGPAAAKLNGVQGKLYNAYCPREKRGISTDRFVEYEAFKVRHRWF